MVGVCRLRLVGEHSRIDALVLLLEGRGLHRPHLTGVIRAFEQHVARREADRPLLGFEASVLVEDSHDLGGLGLLSDDELHVVTQRLPVAEQERGAGIFVGIGFAGDLVERRELVVRIGIGRFEGAVPVALSRFDRDRRAPGAHRHGCRNLAGHHRSARLGKGLSG